VKRSVVATLVLLLPLALTLPHTVRKERARAKHVAESTTPVYWPHDANAALLSAMRARIPRHATIAFRGDRPLYVQSGWVRWVAFVLAPRRVLDGRDADWVVVVGHRPSSGAGRRAWRFGDDWLVER
jgi:hypothetical protein